MKKSKPKVQQPAWSIPRVRYVPLSADAIRAKLGYYKAGYFEDNGSYSETDGKLTVKFDPTITYDIGLSKKESDDTLKHENRHYNDFLARVMALKAAISAAVKAGHDPNIDDRWEWFVYDLQSDANQYHREIKSGTIQIIREPAFGRPR